MSDIRIIETCSCGASIGVVGGRYRRDHNANNPRGAEEIAERWRVEHKHEIAAALGLTAEQEGENVE